MNPATEVHHAPAIDRTALQRRGDRRVFLTAIVLFVLVVVGGFARTYYLKGLFGTPPLASLLVHAHGIVMSAWVALVVAQVWLIRSQNVALHKRVGIAGVWLAALVVVVGFFTAISAAKNGSASFPPNIPSLAFLAVPFFDLVMMVILVGGAIYLRKRPADHKRLMLLALINLIPPALARLPFPSLRALGPLFFFGAPTLLTLIALGSDRWRTGTFNRAFVAGAFLLIASYPVRLMLAGTDAWMRFAKWLTMFALV
jgi:uncharacterized membrane protein YozB (DUF420 family)